MNRKRPVPESDEIPPGQLIWATLTGYPAWPAITCKRANSESCERIKNGRKEIFVIFIEEKPSSAYVDAK